MNDVETFKHAPLKMTKTIKTWTWPCFRPASSTVRGNLGLWSQSRGAVGCDGARSRSLHLQTAADVWTSLSFAARFPSQCWAARLHPTCRLAWHPQRSAFAYCPGCRRPYSMGALSHADRSFGLHTKVSIRENLCECFYLTSDVTTVAGTSYICDSITRKFGCKSAHLPYVALLKEITKWS